MKRFLWIAVAVLLMAGCCRSQYSWEEDLQYRLGVDFSWSRGRVTEYIRQYIPDVTEAQIDKWTSDGTLESMVIDGELRYFNRTAAGLFRVDPACKAIKDAADSAQDELSLSGTSLDGDDEADRNNLAQIIREAESSGNSIAAPQRMRIKYTLTVDADAVPEGETIRCWLPYPRTDVPRQQDVRFIGASGPEPVFSAPSCEHSTLYMEAAAVAGQPTVFSEEFEFTACGQWFDLEKLKNDIKPYDTGSALYREYTSEREAHIIFSDRMRNLAARLTDGLDNPYERAKAIFVWVNDNFPWSGAREYSTIPCIPEYVLDAGHGDCGQVTLLMITLCRICGIPARFESGFMVHRGRWNLHDWAELYFEGIGWVPVDQSFGISEYIHRTIPLNCPSDIVQPGPYAAASYENGSEAERMNSLMEMFFLGGIDSYRMVVNSDYGFPLSPAKKYPRSETVDFQRGEVEWAGGNIYFPNWDYDMDIEYLSEPSPLYQ